MAAPLPVVSLGIEKQDINILHAMCVWGESRGEPDLGRVAVAHVALNRAKRKFGGDLRKAILQKWAFSCFNTNGLSALAIRYKLLRPTMFDTAVIWQSCYDAALTAYQGLSQDPTNGAVVYCTRTLWMRPKAALFERAKWFELPEVACRNTKKLAVIGHHVFADTAI